jgi:tRNA_anti-like
MRLDLQKLTSESLPQTIVRVGVALAIAALAGVGVKVFAKAGTPLVVLAVVAVFLIAIGLQLGARGRASAVTEPDHGHEDVSHPLPASSVSEAKPKAADSSAARQLVDVTPEHLVGFFDTHTSIQAKELVAPYLGKWMHVSGLLGNVSGFTTFSQVTFAFGTFTSLSVYMYFHDREVVENRLVVLSRGDQVTVLGQIDRVDDTLVMLENCELIDVSRPEPAAPQLVFDEAPPGLADMTETSLRELFASRTKAQADELLKQHRGEPVRVSGEVGDVDLTGTPSVHLLSSGIALLLFFDADDYDARPSLLSLHHGDKIVVSGQIHSFTTSTIAGHIGISIGVDKCKLLNTRGGRS